MDLQNHLESWEEILGRWWTPQGEDMPQKFQSQTPYNSQNSETLPRTLWPRVHPKVNKSKAKSGIWGVKIIHRGAQVTQPWSPHSNPERNTLKSTNRATNENSKKRLQKSQTKRNGRSNKNTWGIMPNLLYTPWKIHTRYSLPPQHPSLSQDLTMKLSS
jgi:hypothetical protein